MKSVAKCNAVAVTATPATEVLRNENYNGIISDGAILRSF